MNWSSSNGSLINLFNFNSLENKLKFFINALINYSLKNYTKLNKYVKKANIFILFLVIACSPAGKNESNSVNNNESINSIVLSEPTENNNGSLSGFTYGCGYGKSTTIDAIKLFNPREREKNQINLILKYSGLSGNFIIYGASIDNAIATIINNQRYIFYDPKLLTYSDLNSGHYWTSMSILAHEIGHHLNGHTLNEEGSNHNDELEADKFSGFVLYKLGASLTQSITAIEALGNSNDTKTHPSIEKRVNAIKQGWFEAFNQRYLGAIPPPPNDNASDYIEFNAPMIVHKDLIEAAKEYNPGFYDNPDFLYGVITEVDKGYTWISIRVINTTEEFERNFRNLDNEEWTIGISSPYWDGTNEMCHSCAFNLKSLLVPGRRLKFAMVEGWPGGGTIMNGHWTLIYAKAMDESFSNKSEIEPWNYPPRIINH
jgi:hypothetical protein